MSKLKWVAAGIIGLSMAGVGWTEVREYWSVARAEVAEAIKERIPLSVEIDRLQLLVSQLDEQMAQHKRQVAQASVSLGRADQDLAAVRTDQQQGLQKIAHLRDQLRGDEVRQVRIGCTVYPKAEVERALQAKVERYRAEKQSLQAREAALARQREAFRTQAGRLADLQHQRDLLAQKIATLRSELAAQEMARPNTVIPFQDDTLRRAKELARQIEDRLKVEQKLHELEVDPSDPLPTATVNAAAEADKLLAEEQEPAT